jgi:uncharacterized membrane protein
MWQAVRWQHLLGLAAILVLAIAVRWHHLGNSSLWTDEYLSMECSSGWARSDLLLADATTRVPDLVTLKNARPWTTIWPTIAADENHPPLYFLMLRAWRAMFGDSPVALRSLSVVAAVIAISLLFAVGVVIHSPRAALWACLLMAVATPQIQQSQDARAYMPMTAVCLAAALALVCIDRSGPTRWRCIALFLATLAAPLLHYMAFATLAAMGAYAAVIMRGTARKSVLITLGASLACYARLWGPQLFSQHYRVIDGTAWMITDHASPVLLTLETLCNLPARLFIDLNDVKATGAWLSVVVFVLPLALIRRQKTVWLWWIWLMVPVLTSLVIDLATRRQSLSLIKYTLAAAPAVYLMLGLFAAQIRRTGWLPAGIIAAACMACIPSNYASELPDWRELSKCVLQNTRPGDPVVFVDDDPHAYASDGELSATYYLAGQNRPIYILNRQPNGTLLAELAKARHICVVGSNGASLTFAKIPGMKLDHVELLVGMALLGTEDPVASDGRKLAANMSAKPRAAGDIR